MPQETFGSIAHFTTTLNAERNTVHPRHYSASVIRLTMQVLSFGVQRSRRYDNYFIGLGSKQDSECRPTVYDAVGATLGC